MDVAHSLAFADRKATRSSLACLPCRSRHLKCDGKRPNCSRCMEYAKECHYQESRRGGLDRAALTERRRRLAAANHRNPKQQASQQMPEPQSSSELFQDCIELVGSSMSTPHLSSSFFKVSEMGQDPLIGSYYQNFHRYHPAVLPHSHLANLCRDSGSRHPFEPLLAVMRLIGHLYSSEEWSPELQESIDTYFATTMDRHPFIVQSRLLYSIALFWYDRKSASKEQMDLAIQLALDIGMNHRQFANDHSHGNTVVTESWRRTWWLLYIVDAYYAGTLGVLQFTLMNVEATTDLPCDEKSYISGDIPEPNTIEQFDSREFDSTERSFSSFAYLIGAVRCAALAISTAPRILAKEASTQTIQAVDSIIDGWSLLLPKRCHQVLSKEGEIDELLFQAHLIIHVSTIGLHRPLSDLKFNKTENISSCARDPPPETPTPELVNVHTIRVLKSVEAQIRFLALPVRPFAHTPFTTCMINEGTLALLSACTFLFKGKELAIARDQIRMTIGCLTTLGEIWPRTRRNLQEIKMIARNTFGLASTASEKDTPRSDEIPTLSNGDEESLRSEDNSSIDNNIFTVDANACFSGWPGLSEFTIGLSWLDNTEMPGNVFE